MNIPTALVMAQQASEPTGGAMSQIVILALLFAGMWFLLIAPQRKRQKQHEKMVSELKPGDDVITASGIYGTITAVKADRFTVKIADNTKVDINRAFVQTRVEKETTKDTQS